MSFSDRLRETRKRSGLTQMQIAEKLGITAQSYSQYETGKRQPKAETLKRIADALGVLPGDLRQDGFYPTSQEIAAMKRGAESVTDERRLEIEEKRLSNLIDRKKKMLNISGKQRAADYMDDLTKIPEYRKDGELLRIE